MFSGKKSDIFCLWGRIMLYDLKTLNKPDRMKIAEKHLSKYISELKRHFDFSDFQLISLLENSSKKMKKKRNLLPFNFNFKFFQRKK